MKQLLPKKVRNQRGMAILMVLFFISMIFFLATELAYESSIEYQFSYSGYRNLKAYHGAKSAVELSLFRVLLFKEAKKQFGEQIPDARALDMIWSFPLVWPPQLGEDASLVAKSDLDSVLKDSLQDTQWMASITPESAKINLAALDSPSEAAQQAMAKQIEQLIRNRLLTDDDWAQENRSLNPEEIVNHIIDYIDKDEESRVGGNEGAYYRANNLDFQLPPNRMLRSLDELLRIPGIDATLYDYLAPQLSLFGVNAINVNVASSEVLRSIDPQITEEIATNIRNRIANPEEGPFQNEEDFLGFLSRDLDTNNFNPGKIPLVFSEASSFRIEATAEYQNYSASITAITYDVDAVTKDVEKSLIEQAKIETQKTQETKEKKSTKPPAPQSKPRIVYWEE